MRRLQLKVAAEQDQGPPGHPPSTAKLWVPNIAKINAMYKASIDRKYAQAVAIYRSLPAEIRTDKSIYLRYLWDAEAVSDAEFLVALDGFRRQFPGDPAQVFQDVDYYCLTRNFEEALKSIDKAEKAIGGDPYLNALRAKLLVKAWRHKEARPVADKAIEQEPGAIGFAQLALTKQKGLPEIATEQPIEQTLSFVTLGDATPAMTDVIKATRLAAEKAM